MKKWMLFIVPALFLLLLLTPADLFAEEAGHGEHHAYNWMNFFWKILNFVIFFGALGYFLAKPIGGFLRSRSLNITKELEEARAARDKAQAELTEVRRQLEGLEQEMEGIKEKAARDSETLSQEIADQTRAECERIEKQAEKDLETMGARARRDLREHAAQLSIETAEALIRDAINDKDRGRILAASLEQVGGEG